MEVMLYVFLFWGIKLFKQPLSGLKYGVMHGIEYCQGFRGMQYVTTVIFGERSKIYSL